MKKGFKIVMLLLLFSVLVTNASAAKWDVAQDFSTIQNPNGAWTYGLGVLPETLPGDFWAISAAENNYRASGVFAWHDSALGAAVLKNNSDNEALAVLPGQVGIQGSSSRNAAIRWTSPVQDKIFVAGEFGQVAAGENSTQWIVHNDTNIIRKNLFVSATNEFGFYLDVNVGDTLDFVVAAATQGDQTVVPFDCTIYTSDEAIDQPMEWDLANSFTINQNPNGQWTYGLGVLPWTVGDFWAIATSQTDYLEAGIDAWADTALSTAVFKNNTVDQKQGVAAGQVALQPSSSRNAAVRWISPVEDRVFITGKFGQMNSGENATEYIVHNDSTIIFEKLLTATENSFGIYVDVQKGDTIDFVAATATQGSNTIVPLECKILNSAACSDNEIAKWNLAQSFVKEYNPVDEWSFGSHSRTTLDPNGFDVYADFTDPYSSQEGLAAWYGSEADAVVINKSSQELMNLAPGQVGLYPSETSYASVQWIASSTGTINVDAVFGDGDENANADFWVVFNGSVLVSKDDFDGDYVFNRVLNVYAGDTIEFIAGVGSDGRTVTPIDCSIIATPGFGLGNQVWDAAADFTEAGNPNGDWTYGIGFLPYAPHEGDFWPLWRKISEETTGRFANGLTGWWDLYTDGTTYLGSIQCNDTGSTVNGIRAGRIAIEPTQFRQLALRWTAPANGSVVMTGEFDILGQNNDASYYIIKNDNIRYMWKEKTSDSEAFSFVANVQTGDTFDFIASVGNVGDENLVAFDCRIFAQDGFGTAQEIWDAGQDFSTTENQAKPWSYGYGFIEEPGMDRFVDYPACYTDANDLPDMVDGTCQWRDRTTDHVLYNNSTSVLEYLRPGQIGLVPSWEFASGLRWTSPGEGVVLVEAVFADGNPTAEASFAVIKNRSKLLAKSESDVDPLVAQCLVEDTALGFALEVKEGDTIDFVGGYGRFVTDSVVPVDVRIAPAAGFKNTTLNPKASQPSPADDAAGSSLNPVLTWVPGRDGSENYIYFGTDASLVGDAELLAADLDQSGTVDSGDLLILAGEWLSAGTLADFDSSGSVDVEDLAIIANNWMKSADTLTAINTTNSYMPSILQQGVTYYWRVDEYKDGMMVKGDLWSFTAGLAEDTDVVLHNPDMGWQLQESYVVDQAENGSSNIITYSGETFEGIDDVMLLLSWSDIETSQGVYDFSAVNYAYDYWKSKGKKIDLRMATESLLWWNNADTVAGEGVPQYLINALSSSDVQVRQNEGISYTVVNANNSFYQSRLQAFLNAVAANFDATRPLNYIDLAGFGLWGEWHSGYQYSTLSDRRQALTTIIDIWSAAFPDNYLSLSYSYDPDSPEDYYAGPITYYDPAYTGYYNDFLYYSAFDYALTKSNVTFRRNGCGEAIRCNERKFAQETFAAANHGPLGVEMAGTYMKYRKGQSDYFDVDSAIEDLLSLHANYSTIVGWDSWRAKVFIDSRPDLFNYVLNNLGYRFVLDSLVMPAQTSTDIPVNMVWGNAANGRAVQDYDLVFEFRDLNKQFVAQYLVGTLDTTNWIKGSTYSVDALIPSSVVSAGTYEVYIKMVDPRTDEAIELPLHDSIDGAYPVGLLTVN